MIEAQNVCLNLGQKKILNHVNFRAQTGQITALLGRNGSGKTSLLRCIAGTQERYTGEITLDGTPIRQMRSSERARKISLLPQVLPRPPVTVAELAAFGRQPYLGPGGRLDDRDRAAVEEAMKRAGIASHRKGLVCHLSGGERQLAYFALMLAQDTPAVLLDEPASSLDAEYQRMVYAILRRMRSEGKTVSVILHDLSDALELADYIYVLDRGENCFSGTPDVFLQSDVPVRIFGLEPRRVMDAMGTCYTIFRPSRNSES